MLWFAPLSPETGQIDLHVKSVGEHRAILAGRNIKEFLLNANLSYHSPHKFRHGHIHYGLAHAKNYEDYKAVSMNVLHASTEITDVFYSNLNDGEIQDRISGLNKEKQSSEDGDLELFREFINWKKKTSR